MDFDFETMTLAEMMQLHSELVASMTRRFQRKLAVVFTDVVGSTPYFARFGDVAGRALQQRHFDLLAEAIAPHAGRVVDTAGDGAFVCFEDADQAANAMCALMQLVEQSNELQPAPHRLALRVGVHHGPVLTDGGPVSGDAVNLCARVSGSAEVGQIRATEEAFHAFSSALRVRCRPLPPATLKGIEQPVPLFDLTWRDRAEMPTRVQVLPAGDVIPLPSKDVIRIGRLGEAQPGGVAANDIVLSMSPRIGRWHCEIHRRGDALVLRSVTDAATSIDGRELLRGEEAPLAPGAVVRLGDAVSLMFAGDVVGQAAQATAYAPSPRRP